MKIYTKTGDQGKTSLYGGERVDKDHLRIQAFGDVDELNAELGVVRSSLALATDRNGGFDEIGDLLGEVQNRLFDLGAELATPDSASKGTQLLGDAHVTRLEQAIDRWEAELNPLRQFILPGGSLVAAQLHVARCVCRRAERLVVGLARELATSPPAAIRPQVIVYLNRLSDLLFVLARAANHLTGNADVPWQKADE